ncbi:MAG TPA: radical SAM protein [Candidatus Nanoarchaeia archaeon]|nr:radical SAM protein [Candidatus Nanoarchaeia archaeon]
MKKRLLLLNPPGTKKYFRDYYCTCVSKAKYYYHPLDLVYLSGRLDPHYTLSVIDAVAEELTPEQTLQKINTLHPDIVFFLVSSPSYEEDVPFLTRLRETLPQAKLIGSGDVYREIREKAFALHPFLDATLLDFSTDDLLTYLKQAKGQAIENVLYKTTNGKIIAGAEKHGYGTTDIPVPRWDLFPLKRYIFPFSRRGHYATILTDFGCPFTCTFCPMSTIGFKLRSIDTVVKEVKLLNKLGIHEFFIRDQTFGVNKPRTYQLLEKLKKLDMSWTCFSRVDTVDEKLLQTMKEAGCHTVMFGVETSNEELLKTYKKNIRTRQMIDAFDLCKKIGLRTVGTFIIGLPGETRESIRNTIQFSTQINLDYASFNIATPRFGTTFRKDLLEKGLVQEKVMKMDSAKSKPVFKNNRTFVRNSGGKLHLVKEISNEEIFQLQRDAIRAFYMRPRYLLKRMVSIKTPYELKEHLSEGLSLLFD